MACVAEGVENEAQLTALKAAGCNVCAGILLRSSAAGKTVCAQVSAAGSAGGKCKREGGIIVNEVKETNSASAETAKENQLLIIGLGASAGGLEALQQFFSCMPPDSGLSFVVVQHLSPDYKSFMADILGKHTEMRVLEAENGMSVCANTVYLIPPKKYMTIKNGKLMLTDYVGARSITRSIHSSPRWPKSGASILSWLCCRHRVGRHQRRQGCQGIRRPGHRAGA